MGVGRQALRMLPPHLTHRRLNSGEVRSVNGLLYVVPSAEGKAFINQGADADL